MEIQDEPFIAADVLKQLEPKSFIDENPKGSFIDELRAAGFKQVPNVPAIDNLERLEAPDDKPGKKSGWYVYYEVPNEQQAGTFVGIGVYGSWKGNPERVTWTSKSRDVMSPVESIQFDARMKEAQEVRARALRERQEATADRAIDIWSKAASAPLEHPYFASKGIKPHGARVSRGNITVPVMDGSDMTSLQFIAPDGSKKFLSGGKVKGCHFLIEGDKKRVFITEGFATAATIHEATGATVYAAFNCNNLMDVASYVKDAHLTAEITVAGDDDHKTSGNPGKTKATAAAKVHGCKVVFPEVSGDDTDFNDMKSRVEMKAVTACLLPKAGCFSDVKVSSFADILYDTSILPPHYIGPGLLAQGEVMLIGGPPKAQKTLLTMNLAVSAALGEDFLEFEILRPLQVFYVNAEVNMRIMRKRIREAGKKLTTDQISLLHQNFHITDRFREILDGPGVQGLVQLSQQVFPGGAPDLIIVDPMALVFDGETENDNVAMRRFLVDRLELMRELINPNAAIVIVHHAGKSSLEKLREDPFDCIRGSSALRGHYDSAIIIFRPNIAENYRRVAFEMRGGEAPEPFDIEYCDGGFRKTSHEKSRITRLNLGAKEDAERLRRKDILLGLLLDEAAEGSLYTSNGLACKFEGSNGLGGADSIQRRLKVLQVQGFIRFTKDYAKLKLEVPTSVHGYLVIENMVLKLIDNETKEVNSVPVPSTHYRNDQTSAVLETPKNLPWPEVKSDEK